MKSSPKVNFSNGAGMRPVVSRLKSVVSRLKSRFSKPRHGRAEDGRLIVFSRIVDKVMKFSKFLKKNLLQCSGWVFTGIRRNLAHLAYTERSIYILSTAKEFTLTLIKEKLKNSFLALCTLSEIKTQSKFICCKLIKIL